MIATFSDSLRNLDGFSLDFDQLPATLGRSDEVTIVVNDRWISRKHCRVFAEGEHLVVRDLDSRHGTFVNGERVEEAILAPGDELQIGVHVFLVHYVRTELLRRTEEVRRDDSRITTLA